MQLIVTRETMYCSDAGELAKVVKALEVEQCFETLTLAHDPLWAGACFHT